MDGRHPSSLGVERQLFDPRAGGGDHLRIHVELGGEGEQRRLGRIAADGPWVIAGRRGVERRIVAGGGDLGESLQGGVVRRLGIEPSGRRVAIAGHAIVAVRGPDPLGEHPVLGQGAGLVAADHGDRPEGLDGRQLADERVSLGHPSGAQSQGDRDDGRQAFRDGRDRETHRCQEHHIGRLATGDAADEHEDAHQERRDRQSLAERRQSSLERRLATAVFLEEFGDPSECRLHPGRHDQAKATPIGDRGATEGHVPLVGEDRGGDVGNRSRDLACGFRFARQGGLVDPEGSSLDQAHVGGHHVPRVEPHEVARHELGRRDDGRDAGTNDARRRAGHAFERVHRLFRPVLLDEPDDPVEHDDHQDDGGVLEVTDRRGDRGGTEQDQDHRVGELFGQQAPGRLGGALLELVRPVRDQTMPSLVGIEAPVRIGAEGGDDLRSVDRPWVPDAVDRGDVLDLDTRGSVDAWEHAHVAGSGSSHLAWSGDVGRYDPERQRRDMPGGSADRTDSAASAVPNQAVRPLVDDAVTP